MVFIRMLPTLMLPQSAKAREGLRTPFTLAPVRSLLVQVFMCSAKESGLVKDLLHVPQVSAFVFWVGGLIGGRKVVFLTPLSL